MEEAAELGVAVVHQLGVGADLPVVAGDQLEQA